MLRRLVKSYYRLRYFPRLLTELLTRISNELAELRRFEANELGRMMTAHEERVATLHQEIAAFCDDATHAMMTVSANIAELHTRTHGLQHGVQRLENGSVDLQGRVAALQQSLARPVEQAGQQQTGRDRAEHDCAGQSLDRHDQVGHDQEAQEQGQREQTVQPAPESLETLAELVRREAARVDRIEALVAGQARLAPTSAPAPDRAAPEVAFAATSGLGQPTGDDDRLAHA